MEFGMFHEFQRVPGQTEEDAFTNCRSSRWTRRSARARRDVAGGAAHRARAFGAGRAADDRHRDRRAHQADEDRHRRAGAAAVPSAAARRGGGDRRSDQPRTADLRRRAQRISAGLSGLWRLLCRKPRALRRGAGDPQARLDAGALQLRRPSTTTSTTCIMVPKPYQKPYPEIRVAATSPDTYPANGAHGQSDLLRDAARRSVGAGTEPGGVSRGLGPTAATPATARCSCACRSMSRRPRRVPVPSRKRA